MPVTSALLDPLKVGSLSLPNRVIMAPLTRMRASEGRVPNAMMADYYAQRATAGLILSEATSVSPMGVGYHRTPGIWSEEQVSGWQGITAAVHRAGGRMFLQLWHVGRISDPELLAGAQPVSASAVAASGHVQSAADAATPRSARPRDGRSRRHRRTIQAGRRQRQAQRVRRPSRSMPPTAT